MIIRVLLLLLALALPAEAATFVVDSTGDTADASAGNGVCATAGAVCTLRAAIQEANALAGADVINFTIAGAGPHTITLGSALPNLSQQVTIDGTTEPSTDCGDTWAGDAPDWRIIVSANGFAGFQFATGSANSTIRGIELANVRTDNSSGAAIMGQVDGLTVRCMLIRDGGTQAHGIETNFSGTDGNGWTIGGTDAGHGNVIQAMGGAGVTLFGDDHVVRGNFIGTNVAGTAADANGANGVTVDGGDDNQILHNLLSGNTGVGIRIESGTTDTLLEDNYVGRNRTNSGAVANDSGTIEDEGTGTDGDCFTNGQECGFVPGCCAFSGDNPLSATCVDDGVVPGENSVTSLADCEAISAGFLEDDPVIHYNADAYCTPGGDPTGSCAAPSSSRQVEPATIEPAGLTGAELTGAGLE